MLHTNLLTWNSMTFQDLGQNSMTFQAWNPNYQIPWLSRFSRTGTNPGGTSSHEFASQFGLAFFLYAKNIHKLSRMPRLAHGCWMKRGVTLDSLVIGRPCPASTHEHLMVIAPTDWANTTKTTSQNGDNESLYIHALKMWFRNYYVAYAFVWCV